jgi:hypothetical protein
MIDMDPFLFLEDVALNAILDDEAEEFATAADDISGFEALSDSELIDFVCDSE